MHPALKEIVKHSYIPKYIRKNYSLRINKKGYLVIKNKKYASIDQ